MSIPSSSIDFATPQECISNIYSLPVVLLTCRNARTTGRIEDGRGLSAPNALVADISPFRFGIINLDIPFAFYVLTAVCVFSMLLLALFGEKRLSRGVTWAGAVLSTLASIFIMIASAVITRQMRRLRDQTRDDTRRVTNLLSQTLGSSIGDRTNWYTAVQDVSLGRVVSGLTWTSVVAIANATWIYA
ncbi:uncharacterized protein PAC_12272 [Phialocephala subalpina]|uniref:Uncharacterized protein n=1 Tax=Phialocephala subalpina TaxID=576137 RepID=A0A1L7XBJ6_9HELO|nr:uncharacterized protein PAC_12272 [Phialocephala subalpina]